MHQFFHCSTSNPQFAFRIGNPVWGKMKGFSAWPGKIDMPPEGMKRPTIKKVMHCVFFFGTHDYAWIPETDIKPYSEFKKALTTSKKSVKRAIEEIEEYIAGGCKASTAQILATATPVGANDSMDTTNDDDNAEFDALFEDKPTTASSKKKKRNTSMDSDDASARKKKKSENNHDEFERESSPLLSNHTSNRKSATSAVSSFLDRPLLNRPESPSGGLVDISATSKVLKDKDIQPSKANFGFLGLGIMGSGIVKNLLNSGHSVTVWNRTAEKCDDFVKAGAKSALTPGDVIAESDITFSCVSDPQAAKDMVFGNCGVLSEINTMKGKCVTKN